MEAAHEKMIEIAAKVEAICIETNNLLGVSVDVPRISALTRGEQRGASSGARQHATDADADGNQASSPALQVSDAGGTKGKEELEEEDDEAEEDAEEEGEEEVGESDEPELTASADLEDSSELSASDEDSTWISWFVTLRGNEFFCEVDEDYIQDDFNLTGLSAMVPYYELALDMILDVEIPDGQALTEEQQEVVESAAEMLYGLIHARYILTNRGLQGMFDKFHVGAFGRCPRVFCQGQNVLPAGLSDMPRSCTVAVYCPKCQDIFHPKSTRQANVDGAYFGTTFSHLFLLAYPELIPSRPTQVVFDLPDGTRAEQTFQLGQTVEVLKSYIASEFGIAMGSQELYLGSKLMIDPLSLLDYCSEEAEADGAREDLIVAVVEGNGADMTNMEAKN